MSPKYRLVYFDFMGAIEPIRLLFALAKVPYIDERIPEPEWKGRKPEFSWGVLPVLIEEGKEQIHQSFAILRYLGREFGLAGKSSWETAKCDEYVDAMHDVVKEVVTHFFEADPEKKETLGEKLKTEIYPNFLKRIEQALKKNGTGYLVGKGFTYADLYIAHMASRSPDTADLSPFPNIQKHQELVWQQPEIKKWVETRPVTAM